MYNSTAQDDDHTACSAIYPYSSDADISFLKGRLVADLNRIRADIIEVATKSVNCSFWRVEYTIDGQTPLLEMDCRVVRLGMKHSGR